MAACGEGSLELVRLLLAAGAEPGQANTVRGLRARVCRSCVRACVRA
jgi:hypothetical protein